MKKGIATNQQTLAPGEIRFFDSIQPPLESGSYTLHAEQQILDIPGETVAPYITEQQVLVDGPRFVLNPSQIYSVYPPSNQNGSYTNALPNIVFSNFSLPWSRPIDPPASGQKKVLPADDDFNQAPWMGLLTLYPADLSEKVKAPMTILVSELVNPLDPTILPPVLGDLYGAEDQKVSVVDMDLSFFQSICPALGELPFLGHARAVNTDGKVVLGMDADGCFSLVLGNRLPMGGAKNTVYLVSYEGHQDHLRGSTIGGNYTSIRLVMLGGWAFTSDVAKGSFVQLMQDLCDSGRGGVSLLQMPAGDAVLANPVTKEAIQIGYVPLQNNMRQGEVSTSWYRGPLVSSPTQRDFAYGPYHYSDHAIQYDPEYGIFNHAYSAAWQIGRLLALSDGSFSSAFFNWRNEYLRTIVLDAQKIAPDVKRAIAGLAEGETIPENMRDTVLHLFTNGMKKVGWPQVRLRPEVVLGDHLSGVFTGAEKQTVLTSDEDPLIILVKKIKEGGML